jgi:prepilin-type N-terminal cleavage/methylation domain-containing protein
MCKFNSKMGFTLIELMVVIVIIGVLASLAIPRFTEASDKAKIAEVPRIIASWESAQLANIAERSMVGGVSDLIFELPVSGTTGSKWFEYTAVPSGENSDASAVATITGTARGVVGKINSGAGYTASVNATGTVVRGTVGWTKPADAKKYAPNFVN